jgi:hypothetical protein
MGISVAARSAQQALLGVLALTAGAPSAWAQLDTASESSPPISEHYIQYGLGITAETVVSAGSVCPSDATEPCILGSGLGLAVRGGYRARGPWYFGGSYEFSRQDPSNLLRLAILQQLRAEARYYLSRDARLNPYATMSAGGALYGNEWGVDTGGLTAFVGGGLEFEVSRTTLVGAMLGYRPLVFRRWTDGAGQLRADQIFGFGMAHRARATV